MTMPGVESRESSAARASGPRTSTLDFRPASAFTLIEVMVVVVLLALMLGGVGFPGGAVYLRNDLMRSPAWRMASCNASAFMTVASIPM